MSNAILIKEVNNQPVIFNVDNATDEARLEALQAVKMAEDMVASVFGEQSNFADNTTCLVSPNANNPAFPYGVTFDESKIQAKPKRYYGWLAEMAMPSNDFIDIPITINKPASYTAPANGYVYLHFGTGATGTFSSLLELTVYSDSSSILSVRDILKDASWSGNSIFVPVKKGQSVSARMDVSGTYPKPNYVFRFVYAEGEI